MIDDDVNSVVMTGRLWALAADMPLSEPIARIHSGLHTHALRAQLREARTALALATRREGA